MSKATIVSTLPFMLSEPKPMLVPYLYEIPPALKGGFSTKVIEDAFYFELIPLADDRVPPRRVPVLAKTVADSLIQDYIGASIEVSYDPLENGALRIPGLFAIDGHKHPEEIKANNSEELSKAYMNTRAWFDALVKRADDDWQRNHMHKSISDLQRKACTYLEYQKEWNFDVFTHKMTLCWACKQAVNPEAIICGGCKAILNASEYAKKKEQFANA